MSTKKVDCIILAMLKEERELFLKNNNCLIYDKARECDDFLEFAFFDKNLKLKTGVFCSGDREMGNSEAGKLFYRVSREYSSELYINIGVVGYINEVNIGDVIIVDDCYSLCEKNVANSELQKTDAQFDKFFIKKIVFKKLDEEYQNEFKRRTKEKKLCLYNDLKEYVKENSIDKTLKDSLEKTCIGKDYNVIKLGACATYHSVVKDDGTRGKIRNVRKTNIVDMEAYYFNDWHNLVKNEEKEKAHKESKIIFVKSVSDTAIEDEKVVLEKIHSRDMAMSNIYDVVSFYLSHLHDFLPENSESLLSYFRNKISYKHIDKLIKHETRADTALDKLCTYLIIEDSIAGQRFNENYIELTCQCLKNKNQTLVLQGRPGKGKSTFISLVYEKFEKEQPAIFISIPELQNESNGISITQSLYLLERLLKENEGLTVFIDGIEGSRKKNSNENEELIRRIKELLNQYDNRNISLCIGTWNIKNFSDEDFVSSVSACNRIASLTFKSVSSLDNSIRDFITCFGEFFEQCECSFNVELFVENAIRIVENQEFQLKYVDFRLLYMFANNMNILINSISIFDFIKKYSDFQAKNELQKVINDVGKIIGNEYPADISGLLTKNIYSRAYVFAQFVFGAFIKEEKDNINIILSNQFILSHNMNLFLEYLLNTKEETAKKFVKMVLKYLKEKENCHVCSKIQLLYNVSSIKCLDSKTNNSIKEYILEEIDRLAKNIQNEQDSRYIIGYRTLAIILNNKFKVTSYLSQFNFIISSVNKNRNAEMIRKINKNFHLLYYSQTEFTYSKVEENSILFEPEVIWNTYYILVNNLLSDRFNSEFVETCTITLIQLIKYIKITSSKGISEDELETCLAYIRNIQNKYSLLYVNEEMKNIEKLI